MKKKLPEGVVRHNACVAKIAPVRDANEVAKSLKVTIGDEDTREYSHVISTIPLGAVRMVNLDECKISYALSEALRTLGYGPSTKIGMRFKTRWWERLGHMGGISKTDRYVLYVSAGASSLVTWI